MNKKKIVIFVVVLLLVLIYLWHFTVAQWLNDANLADISKKFDAVEIPPSTSIIKKTVVVANTSGTGNHCEFYLSFLGITRLTDQGLQEYVAQQQKNTDISLSTKTFATFPGWDIEVFETIADVEKSNTTIPSLAKGERYVVVYEVDESANDSDFRCH